MNKQALGNMSLGKELCFLLCN